MRSCKIPSIGALIIASASAQSILVDLSNLHSTPIAVSSSSTSLTVHWKDERSRSWQAIFALDPKQPLISAISIEGRTLIQRARPFYQCETGKRRGGWDAFFDFPPSAPEGTRAFIAEFHPKSVHARSIGDRVELSFDGLTMGIFHGSLRYIFYPGSRLIEQQAVMSTDEPDVAYHYDAGLRMASLADETSGGNMNSHLSYIDTSGTFQTFSPVYGPERKPLAVRYRTLVANLAAGSVAVFPAPHQYFFARDYTTNMGYLWYTAWRGTVSLGIRQLHDDDSPFYPWMNAPPGTSQEMRMFLLVSEEPARPTLDAVAHYTHHDHFPKLPGYVRFAPHWHLAYTVQARSHGFDWTPPFKPAMQAIGLDAAMIMDFHGDGHPADNGTTRLEELRDYFRACAAQSDPNFLLIPAEEANVHLGGHWALVFPKPVYWHMSRQPNQPFIAHDPTFGTVYNVGDAEEMWDLVTREHGYAYQTHPRTKGSTGYPDAIENTAYFQDARYLGAGWKAMPSDLSSPRLGERAFKTIDDMNNLGRHKRMIGEVDVFQLDSTHELYGHINVNYVRLPALPSYAHYGDLLDALAQGDSFITTGEILIPNAALKGDAAVIHARVHVSYTFPLRLAEIVWGDGVQTHHESFSLENTNQFGERDFEWQASAPAWKWARLAIWDIAGNGAFTNPIWAHE